MPSIREVAKQAGVSIATVSRVVNGVTNVDPRLRQRVMKVVDEIDYTPATRRNTSDAVALVYLYPGPATTGSLYDSACIQGIIEELGVTENDLRILTSAQLEDSESLSRFLARKGAWGAIVRCTSKEREIVREWTEEKVPMVVLGDHFDDELLPFVYASSKSASQQAIELLVSLNHKRIAFAACDREDGDHRDRFDAYSSVLKEHDLFDKDLVWRVPPHRFDGSQIIRNMLSRRNRPTAIYIADPLIAVGALNECHRLKVRVPEDLSIIGFDDTDLRTIVYPRLTAVCQDSKSLGKLAVQKLMAAASPGGDMQIDARPDTWLDVGATTGPAPSKIEIVMPSGQRAP